MSAQVANWRQKSAPPSSDWKATATTCSTMRTIITKLAPSAPRQRRQSLSTCSYWLAAQYDAQTPAAHRIDRAVRGSHFTMAQGRRRACCSNCAASHAKQFRCSSSSCAPSTSACAYLIPGRGRHPRAAEGPHLQLHDSVKDIILVLKEAPLPPHLRPLFLRSRSTFMRPCPALRLLPAVFTYSKLHLDCKAPGLLRANVNFHLTPESCPHFVAAIGCRVSPPTPNADHLALSHVFSA
jgi:hypothetical protein